VACTLAVSGGVALSGASAEAHTPRAHAAGISINSFTNSFSSMKALKPIVAKGTGKIAAIMPDTTSSTRYVEFDQPDIKKALQASGMPASDIITPQNAQKSDTTFLTDVKADITNGAKVILIDPEDPGTGVQAEVYAKAHGAKIVQYDRLSSGAGAVHRDARRSDGQQRDSLHPGLQQRPQPTGEVRQDQAPQEHDRHVEPDDSQAGRA